MSLEDALSGIEFLISVIIASASYLELKTASSNIFRLFSKAWDNSLETFSLIARGFPSISALFLFSAKRYDPPTLFDQSISTERSRSLEIGSLKGGDSSPPNLIFKTSAKEFLIESALSNTRPEWATRISEAAWGDPNIVANCFSWNLAHTLSWFI